MADGERTTAELLAELDRLSRRLDEETEARKRAEAEAHALRDAARERLALASELERERQAARASESRLRRLRESRFIGIFSWARDGRVLEANTTFLELIGYTREELLAGALRWTDITPPDFMPLDERALAELDAVGACAPFEKEYIHKKGRRVSVLIGLAYWEGSRAEGVAWVLDITRRKEVEAERDALLVRARIARAEAEDQRAYLHSTFMQAPAAIALLRGPTHVYELSNARNDALAGGRKLVGRSVREVLPELVGQGFADLLDRVYATGEPFIATEVAVRVNDSEGVAREHFLNGFYEPMRGHDGRVAGIIAFAYEVTDLVRSRLRAEEASRRIARLQAVTEALSEAATPEQVCEVVVREGVAALGGAAGAVFRLNEAGSAFEMIRTRGYTDQVVGLFRAVPVDAPLPLADAARARELVLLGSPEEAFARYPVMATNSAADRRAWASIPLLQGDRASGVIALSFREPRAFNAEERNIMLTLGRLCAEALDRARLLEIAERERERAHEANRAKDEFLATVSHELRTPLSAIVGWIRMLRSAPLSEERRERALAIIERNADAQRQLIEDLLDISRIISGKLRLTVAPVDLVDVIERSVDAVQHAADARDIRLTPVLDPDAGPVMGDTDRLQQVVWNLLSNAVKFTPKGGRVTVSLCRAGSSAEITVEDTGPGIAPEFLPHVFERFRQAESGTARSHGGLGLGLAIVRHLVELHGGTIEARSDGDGRGATFTVKLPVMGVRAGAAVAPGSTSREPSAAAAAPIPDLAGLCVLVVDDEPDVRELLQSVLEASGVRVVAAAGAKEALEVLRRARPDVVVSDIGMPGEDGYSLMRSIRSLPPEEGGGTPAVALTAYARAEDRTRALMVGFNMHVAKPIDPTELLIIVANLGGRLPMP